MSLQSWLDADPSREALVEAIRANAPRNLFLDRLADAIVLWKGLTASQEAKAWEVLDAIAEERSAPKAGGWLGAPGQKILATATVTRVDVKRTDFRGGNDMHIYEMETGAGNTLAYLGQKHDLIVGDAVHVTGIVKRHAEFKGKKSTVLSRPKFTKLDKPELEDDDPWGI